MKIDILIYIKSAEVSGPAIFNTVEYPLNFAAESVSIQLLRWINND